MSKQSYQSQHSSLDKKRRKSRWASRLDRQLMGSIGAINTVGKSMFGDWWNVIALTIQDAVTIFLIIWIPVSVFQFSVLGGSYKSIESCSAMGLDPPKHLACIVIVVGDYLFWILLLGRFIGRFLAQIRK